MARPRKKGMDYFPHFTNSSMDLKISAMEMQFGFAGYAFYFKLLEILYADENTNLKHPGVIPACAKKIGITVKKFNAMLEYALSVGLFEKSAYEKTGEITSETIKSQLASVHNRRVSDAETPTETPTETPQYVPEIREEKIREDKSREEEKRTEEDEEETRARVRENPEGEGDAERGEESPSILRDPDMARVVRHYEQEMGRMLTPAQLESLSARLTDIPADLICEAVNEAVRHDARSMAYVDTVLDNWAADGVADIQTLALRREEIAKRKKGGARSGADRPGPDTGGSQLYGEYY